LVTDGELRTVQQTLRALNPQARQVVTSYGIVEEDVLAALEPSDMAHLAHEHDEKHEHAHGGQVALGLEAYSLRVLPGPYDEGALRRLLAALGAGEYGRVVRAKGIVTVRRGWVQFDLAGGEASIVAHAHRPDSDQRATVIGSGLDRAAIEGAFAACAVAGAEQGVRLGAATV
jgi:G3E family GTPase